MTRTRTDTPSAVTVPTQPPVLDLGGSGGSGPGRNPPPVDPSLNPRPRAANYDAATRRVLDVAIEFYHADMLREMPFPPPHMEIQWAKAAWTASCDYYGTCVEHDPVLLKLARKFICLI